MATLARRPREWTNGRRSCERPSSGDPEPALESSDGRAGRLHPRARRPRRAVRGAAPPRLHGRRADGARRRDRLRRDRRAAPTCRSGWTDEQDGGRYRLRRRDDEALFGYAVGPHSWKRYQLPAEVTLWRARVDERRRARPSSPSRRASRRATRSSARAPASCTRWGSSTACCSAARTPIRPTGPARGRVRRRRPVRRRRAAPASASRWAPARSAERGFDLALTEVLDDGRHHFVVEVGSERGAEVLAEVPHRDAAGAERARGRRGRARAGPRRRWAASSTRPASRSCCTATTSTRAGTRSPSAA